VKTGFFGQERGESMSETQSTYNYKVVRQFAVMTVIWGIVGMLVGVIIAAQLVWPELNLSASCISAACVRCTPTR
jgi:cbb3-type cytochrome oxidase subunit 1